MITLEQFLNILNRLAEYDRSFEGCRDCKSFKLFRDGLVEINDPLFAVINQLWCTHFTKEGVEWIEWFLYEKKYYKEGFNPNACNRAYSEDGKEIVRTPEELYELLVTDYLLNQNNLDANN